MGRFLEVAQALTRAVEALHRHELIHKDICPANVFYNPRSGQVKLGNLGLASVLTRERQEFRNPALIEGTLAYISPEQTGRMNRAVDHRADLYALGAVAYFLLTGSPPFSGKHLIEICGQHLHGVPVPPSQRLGRPVPAGLERLVLECLAKKPEQRPRDASSLQQRLLHCASEAPWTLDEARDWWREQQQAAACMAATSS